MGAMTEAVERALAEQGFIEDALHSSMARLEVMMVEDRV
jgi:hypothetical protein